MKTAYISVKCAESIVNTATVMVSVKIVESAETVHRESGAKTAVTAVHAMKSASAATTVLTVLPSVRNVGNTAAAVPISVIPAASVNTAVKKERNAVKVCVRKPLNMRTTSVWTAGSASA